MTATETPALTEDQAAAKALFLKKLRAFEGQAVGPPEPAPDEVNLPMIRHWVEAIGDKNPIYTDPAGPLAPPVMLQAWVMRGFATHRQRVRPTRPGVHDELMALLNEAGFTSVVATNCEQTYARYLRPGDRLTETRTIESVSEEKATALGTGHFVTTQSVYRDQDGEVVGTMRFRILKFKPRLAAAGRPRRPQPALTDDNRWWFEAAAAHRLLIQRCTACGELRHPPGPYCPRCRSAEWDTVEACGRGTVYSFVVNHHPQVAAFDYPLVVGLIELAEGTRLVANITGCAPEAVSVGMDVVLAWQDHDDGLTLPAFRRTG